MKETSNNVNETLTVLLSELKKIKDLNNLANEYKKVAQDLLIGLNDYYLSTKDVPDSFIVQMKLLNGSIVNLQEDILHAIDEKAVLLTSKIEGTSKDLDLLKNQMKKLFEDVGLLKNKLGDMVTETQIGALQQEMSRSNALETQIQKDVDSLKREIGNVEACMHEVRTQFGQIEMSIDCVVSRAFSSVGTNLRNVSENQKKEIGMMSNMVQKRICTVKNRINFVIFLILIYLMAFAALFVYSYFIES